MMEIKIKYEEIPGINMTQVDEKNVKIWGQVDVLLLKKKFETILTLVRVGYSSLTFRCQDKTLIKIALKFIPKEFIDAVFLDSENNVKIDLRKIDKIKKVTDTFKLDDVLFTKSGVEAKISLR